MDMDKVKEVFDAHIEETSQETDLESNETEQDDTELNTEEPEEEQTSETKSEKSEDEQTKETDEDSEKGIHIDEELYQAAIDRGMTEEQIFEAHEKFPQLLKNLVKEETLSADEEPELTIEEMGELQLSEEQAEAIKKLEGGEALQQLLDAVNEKISSINQFKAEEAKRTEELRNKEQQRNLTFANRKMDDLSKQFPEFGTVATLRKVNGKYDQKSKEFQTRAKLYEVAEMFHNNGMADTFEDAMEQAVNHYRGSNPDTMKRELVEDVNAQKKRFIPRPTAKKTKKPKISMEESLMEGIKEHIAGKY